MKPKNVQTRKINEVSENMNLLFWLKFIATGSQGLAITIHFTIRQTNIIVPYPIIYHKLLCQMLV